MRLLWWLSNKESACNAGNVGPILGSRRSPGEGNGNPLQYSCLENSSAVEPGGLQSMELQKEAGRDSASKPPPFPSYKLCTLRENTESAANHCLLFLSAPASLAPGKFLCTCCSLHLEPSSFKYPHSLLPSPSLFSAHLFSLRLPISLLELKPPTPNLAPLVPLSSSIWFSQVRAKPQPAPYFSYLGVYCLSLSIKNFCNLLCTAFSRHRIISDTQ